MRKLLFPLFTLLSITVALAQSPAPAPAEQSDPGAKKILDKLRKKYADYKTLEAAFTLVIEVPGQAKETQKGTIGQEGEKFRLNMDQQVIVSDGQATWVYQKKNNEVQINNAEPAGSDNGFMTPKDLLSRYQKGDYLYSVVDKITEGGKVLTQIEFKPKNKSSEYSKLRVSVDEKAGAIKTVKAFAKDGSRYTFTITSLSPNKALGADYFTFDTKRYPGVKVEDLRM